jgi:hypothetical protein
MIMYLERKKRLFKKNLYFFKIYNSSINNYEILDIDKLKNISKNHQFKIFKFKDKIIVDLISYKFTMRYHFKIDKMNNCGFLKSNKNLIISNTNIYKNTKNYPLFKIGKINKNQFKIIINKYNYSNLNRHIFNNYLYITSFITLLLFN